MAHTHSIKQNSLELTAIAAISATVGALTAMLLTPRTGAQARNGITRRAIRGKDLVMDKIHSAKDQTTEKTEDIKDQAAKVKDTASNKTADMADKVKDKAK
jgi:gas vesicle protein